MPSCGACPRQAKVVFPVDLLPIEHRLPVETILCACRPRRLPHYLSFDRQTAIDCNIIEPVPSSSLCTSIRAPHSWVVSRCVCARLRLSKSASSAPLVSKSSPISSSSKTLLSLAICSRRKALASSYCCLHFSVLSPCRTITGPGGWPRTMGHDPLNLNQHRGKWMLASETRRAE